jgi:hypothetical protein
LNALLPGGIIYLVREEYVVWPNGF